MTFEMRFRKLHQPGLYCGDFLKSHIKQHSSKTTYRSNLCNTGFGVIQNDIALKRFHPNIRMHTRFGVIQNNIALKLKCKKCRFGFVIALLILARYQFCMIPCFFINVIHNSIIIIQYVKQKYNCLKFSVLDRYDSIKKHLNRQSQLSNC